MVEDMLDYIDARRKAPWIAGRRVVYGVAFVTALAVSGWGSRAPLFWQVFLAPSALAWLVTEVGIARINRRRQRKEQAAREWGKERR